jgi:hypothetical protein
MICDGSRFDFSYKKIFIFCCKPKIWLKMLARRGEQLGDHVQAVEVLPHPALRALDEEALRVSQIFSSCIR